MAETTRPPLVEPRDQPSRTANPFGMGEVANARPNGLVSVEQQRAIAEVQARMIIARANGEANPIRASEMILNDCTRPTLANRAVYQVSRGGTDIKGPSIRLAEAIAQRWGISRAASEKFRATTAIRNASPTRGISKPAFMTNGSSRSGTGAIAMKSAAGAVINFTSERDIYELIANYGQRRKRAVLLAVIPGDITEAALEQCERTMEAEADISDEGLKKLVEAFAALNVTQAQIETRIQRRLDAIRPAQVVALRKVYNSLRDGMSEVGDWFDAVEQRNR